MPDIQDVPYKLEIKQDSNALNISLINGKNIQICMTNYVTFASYQYHCHGYVAGSSGSGWMSKKIDINQFIIMVLLFSILSTNVDSM